MSQELLPCPFCGEYPDMWEDNNGYWYVDCKNKNCFIQPETRYPTTKHWVIVNWNTRQLEELDVEKCFVELKKCASHYLDLGLDTEDTIIQQSKAICQRFGSKKCEVDVDKVYEAMLNIPPVHTPKEGISVKVLKELAKAIKQAHDEGELRE